MLYSASLVYTLVSEDAPDLLDQPEKVVDYMKGAFDESPENESIWVILVDSKNRPKARIPLAKGSGNGCVTSPSDVFRPAILASAAAIIIAHNHPSGNPVPSSADIAFTREMRESGKVLRIDLLDHLIIGRKTADPSGKGYYSFRESGLV